MDHARQMLDELMGRNRNLHPSEAPRKVNWDDQDFCQYYIVKFCPHDLFVNTRADLGPCVHIHDDEAKELYAEARPSVRKREYEDEFLRFCNTMLNDVDRKIQKGKQRLQLMNKDHPNNGNVNHLSKYQEQLNNMNARVKKLVQEAEEAGIRGDVDQAQDLMILCEQLKEERDALVNEHEANMPTGLKDANTSKGGIEDEAGTSPKAENETSDSNEGGKKDMPWRDAGTLPEKQMEVCEVCGAFLIVGDAQQRIEDHLMGKQHLGYSKLRKAVEEIHDRREKEREEEEKKRREGRGNRGNAFNRDNDRRNMTRDRDQRDRHRGGGGGGGGGFGGGGGGGGGGGFGSVGGGDRFHNRDGHFGRDRDRRRDYGRDHNAHDPADNHRHHHRDRDGRSNSHSSGRSHHHRRESPHRSRSRSHSKRRY